MVHVEALEIDDWILDKIEAKHGVTFGEVEEICYSSHHARRGREGLYGSPSLVGRERVATCWWS